VAPWAAFVVVAGDYVDRRDELVRRFEIIAVNPSVYWLVTGHRDALPDLVQLCFDRFATGLDAVGRRPGAH